MKNFIGWLVVAAALVFMALALVGGVERSYPEGVVTIYTGGYADDQNK